MDLTVSPDLDAYYCYALVLALGVITASGQISKRLANLPGKWIMVNTWLLFFAYTLLPVCLFWFLDRSNAIHDTSLFAAILIGVGYQQILSGELSSIRIGGDISKIWQPFSAWADHVGDRIRNRIVRNEKLFDEALLNTVRNHKEKVDTLQDLAFTHTKDMPRLNAELQKIEQQKGVLGETGSLRKKVEAFYNELKLSESETWQFLLYKSGITSKANYLWYGKEWNSKTAAAVVGIILIASAGFSLWRFWTPENRGRYYVWRIEKANNTDQDRFRAGRHLIACLTETGHPYPNLTELLRFDGVPVKVADNVLTLLVESRELAPKHQVELPVLLSDSLRTTNPDIRARVHATLLYLAEERKAEIGTLKDWKPSAKDSSTDIDVMIRQWKQVRWNQ